MRAYSFREKNGLRSFLYLTERIVFKQEIAWARSFCHVSFGFDGEDGWGVSLALPGLAVWWRLAGVFPRINKEREVKVSVHGNAVWWTVWRDWRDGWSRRIPRWREGSFHFDDFLLGPSKCSQRVVEERAITVPMPERSYPATAKLVEYTWKRPRWFVRRMMRVQIDLPEGIPHEGKGENSWDCGTDATYGITTGECRTIAAGVGVLVGSVLEQRIKHGGWRDWKWERNEEPIR